jgi:hypothetical protein
MKMRTKMMMSSRCTSRKTTSMNQLTKKDIRWA